MIEQDLALLRALAGWAERLLVDGKRLRPREVVAEFDKYLHDELDLMHGPAMPHSCAATLPTRRC